MNNLAAYISYLMWQFIMFANYITRILTIFIITLKDTYFAVLYQYFPPDDIVFIENSTIKFGCTYNNFFQLTVHSYDYLVFNHTVDNKILKKLTTTIKDLPIHQDFETNLALIPKPCNFQFIMVILNTATGSFDITNILNNNDNFYYVQNATILDDKFIDWIFLKHLHVKPIDVTVVALDNNAEEITLTAEQCIRLGTNGYTVELISQPRI